MGNLSTPNSVQKLQTALHAKAKAEPGYRFYALYDKISREEAGAESLIQHLGPGAFDAASMMERKANDFPSVRYWRSVRKAIARKAMVGSAENNLEGVFEAQTAEPADEGGFGPSVDGVRLVRAFVCIRSPGRRQAVLEYALDQAKMDLR